MKRTLALLLAAVSIASAQQRPAITGIAFVRMYAADAGASTTFYSGKLGFDRSVVNGIAHYEINRSQSIDVAPLPSPAPPTRLAAVAFTTSNAAALERYLRAHAVPVVQSLKHNQFGVRDPEGNLILFVQQSTAPAKDSPRATSRRIIHAGFVVKDPAAEDRFYRDILGFRPYWHGGAKDGRTDWISSQVPDGTDWLEYMLNSGPNASPHQLGVMNHVSLGVVHMDDAIQALARNGCTGPECSNSKLGLDGKVQLNLFDPDLTRIEYMEFEPSGTICCSPFTGKQPSPNDPQ
jgi:catechol 2,3-dioxygenase-like lactoylglutathione lyase family enzyme